MGCLPLFNLYLVMLAPYNNVECFTGEIEASIVAINSWRRHLLAVGIDDVTIKSQPMGSGGNGNGSFSVTVLGKDSSKMTIIVSMVFT